MFGDVQTLGAQTFSMLKENRDQTLYDCTELMKKFCTRCGEVWILELTVWMEFSGQQNYLLSTEST